MKAKIFSLLILVMSLISCSKDDDATATVYPEENPLSAYLTNSGFSQEVFNSINSPYDDFYEFGLKFTPTVKGKINAITVKLPADATDIRVTFWDVATETILRTETVPSVIADEETKYTLSEVLNLTKDNQYMITFNSADWYYRTKTDGSDATYPVTAGNINIDGYAYTSGTAQAFPINPQSNYYAGDLSFVFQQVD